MALVGYLEPVVLWEPGIFLVAFGFGEGCSILLIMTSDIRLKKRSGKIYVLKSAASTGPRRILAASQRCDSS